MAQHETIFNRSFILMLITGFLLYMSLMMVSPILSTYANALNATGTVVGLLAGIFAIASLMIRPISGNAVDLKDKKKLLIGAIIVVLIALTGYSFSTSIQSLFFFRILHGLGWGFGSTTCMTIATDALPHKKIAAGVGFYGMMQMLASAIAPSLGLAIAGQWGFQSAFLFATLMALLALLMTPFVKTVPTRNQGQSLRKSIKLKNIVEIKAVMPALLTFANTMASSAIGTFLVLYAAKYNILNIGLYFTVNALVMFGVRPLMGYLTQRLGLHKIIIVCEILIALSMIMMALSTNLSAILMVAVVCGVGASGASPALVAKCIHATTPNRRGIATSTNFVGIDGGSFLGSFLAGILVTAFGYAAMFGLFALPILGLLPFYSNFQKKKHSESLILESGIS